MLTKLRSKGHVKPVPSIGRGFLLEPIVEREAVAKRSISSLLAPLFQDSPRQAIVQLLDHDDAPDADLDESVARSTRGNGGRR